MMRRKLKTATDKVCYIGVLFVILVWLSSMPDVVTFFPDIKGVIATSCSITFTALPFLLLIATGIFSNRVSFYMFRLLLAAGTLVCDIVVYLPRYLLADIDVISNRWSLILLPAFQLGILSALVLLYLAIRRTEPKRPESAGLPV